MSNPYQPPDSVGSVERSDNPLTPLKYRALAGLVAVLIGGGSAFAIGYLFIATPMQRILGPRYSEFDFFGVIGVTVVVPIIALAGTVVAVQQGVNKLRATFRPVNLLLLTVAPLILILALTLFVDGEWAWMGVVHLATCLGILSAARLALYLTPTA